MKIKSYALVGLIAAAIALAGCSFSIGSNSLDMQKAEDEIAQGIQQQAGVAVSVVCPEEVPIEAGASFECQATDTDGNSGTVKVVQDDDEGNITWELLEGNDLAGNNLNMKEVEDAIVKGIKEQTDVDATVDCPTTVLIEAGTSFNCTAHDEDGETRTVVVTQTDDTGSITWELK